MLRMLKTRNSLFIGRNRPSRPRTVHPALEALEERQVPTVTYQGGALLQNVEVQAIYYGADWQNNAALYQQTGQFEKYLGYLVNSPYMDMLGAAGYNVGRGSQTGGVIDLAPDSTIGPPPAVGLPGAYNYGHNVVSDSAIQRALQNLIVNRQVAQPDNNRLYVVFVAPNVEVIADDSVPTGPHPGLWDTSLTDFAGYHTNAFLADANGLGANVHYAVVDTPGGTVGNGYAGGDSFLSQFDEMTMAASHEIAEAVTDPDGSPGARGWFDNGRNMEIGDIVNGQVVRLNGYAVQKEADQNDLAMSPASLVMFNNNFNTLANVQFTGKMAYGFDTTGLTNVNNLVAYIYWGDNTSSFGSATLGSNGVFYIYGTHTYNSAGTFSTTAYIYDATNATDTARFIYDSITTSYLHYFPPLGAASAIPGAGTTPGSSTQMAGSSMQMALALAPPSSASASTNGAAPGGVVSPSSGGTPASTGLSAVYAADAAAANTVQPDRIATPQSDAGTAMAAVRMGQNARLIDAIFAGNPLDPLALVLAN
jgi:hypothetical protein